MLTSICQTCKYWRGNGGMDCSDDTNEYGDPVKECPYYEEFEEEVWEYKSDIGNGG